MDVTALTQVIGSLGFPIVCCGYMMVTMNKTLTANTKATQDLSAVVQRLLDRMDRESAKDVVHGD